MGVEPANPNGPGRPEPNPPDGPTGLWNHAGLGLEFAGAIGAFVLLGWWLDSRWNTSPWLLLAGVAAGFAAGMYRLIRVMRVRQERRQ